MVKDALALWLDADLESGDVIPPASNPAVIFTESEAFVSLVDVDLDVYRKEHVGIPLPHKYYQQKEIPKPSPITAVECSEDEIVSMVH